MILNFLIVVIPVLIAGVSFCLYLKKTKAKLLLEGRKILEDIKSEYKKKEDDFRKEKIKLEERKKELDIQQENIDKVSEELHDYKFELKRRELDLNRKLSESEKDLLMSTYPNLYNFLTIHSKELYSSINDVTGKA